MKCEACGERAAEINYVELTDGKKKSRWLCAECAEKDGITPPDDLITEDDSQAIMSDLIGSIETTAQEASPPRAEPVCSTCGYSLQNLQQSGMLGCPECYTSFRSEVQPILRRFHRETTHVGKVSRGRSANATVRQQIASLRVDLNRAVSREDYEEAARLRDTIEQLKSQAVPADDSAGTRTGETGSPAERPGAATDSADREPHDPESTDEE